VVESAETNVMELVPEVSVAATPTPAKSANQPDDDGWTTVATKKKR